MSGSRHASQRGNVIRTRAVAAVVSVLAAGGVVAGVLLVEGHGVVTRTGSSSHPTTSASATASSVAPITASSPAPITATSAPSVTPATVTPTPTPSGTLTYLVKPGDNLVTIAAYFKLHGYGSLYDANKAVLGQNPSLIHPGQVITISSAGLTTSN